MEKNLNLCSPWVNYYREIEALFGDDPDIRIEYDEDELVIKMYVEDQEKADALGEILDAERTFGNVTVTTEIIPANKPMSKLDILRKAFANNPAFSFSCTVDGAFNNPISYFVFRNKVVQYECDSLDDPYGNRSTLYQEIAKDVLGSYDGIYYATDLPDNTGTIKK